MGTTPPGSVFSFLESVLEKPRPFSFYTTKELWTDEHTSKQMLALHLDGAIDVSSRHTAFIDDSARWMTERFELSAQSRVIDFGCGPGLYTSRLARTGAEVCGIDFSPRSIGHARESATREGLSVSYVEADYLEYRPEGTFDLIIMIMCDFCALSPAQRAAMLAKFAGLLSDRGRVVLDVYSLRAFADKREGVTCEENQLNGFWSTEPYFGCLSSIKYDDEKVSLDKYTIVERHRQRENYNWLQYFTPDSLGEEARGAGLVVDEILGDVAGGPYDADAAEFAVVMKTD